MNASAGVEITGPVRERYDEILTQPALALLAELHRAFDGRRRELLGRRAEREAELAAGGTLDFLDETKDVREAQWRVADPAPGLVDRRVGDPGPRAPPKAHKARKPRAKASRAAPEARDTRRGAHL